MLRRGAPLLLEEGVSPQDRVLADAGTILGTATEAFRNSPGADVFLGARSLWYKFTRSSGTEGSAS